MKNEILFSVIIPTYNRANFIEKTINSVLNQTYGNFEIIVVDDGSTDNTEDIVIKIEDNRLFYYKKANEERGVARNFGGKKAKGKYVYFLDSDDLLYENHLEVAYEYSNYHNPDIFFQQYEFTLENGEKRTNIRINTDQPINTLLFSKGNFMSCHGVFIKRDVFLKNQFCEDRRMAGSEDYELWLRLASRFPILFSDQVTSTLVFHNDRSVLNFSKEQLILRFELFLKNISKDPIFHKKYKDKYLKLIESESYSYVALHLALIKDKKTAKRYFIKSLKSSPKSIFKRRSLAILKHLFS